MSTLHDQLEAAIKERLAVAQKAGADGPAWSIHGSPLYTDPVLLASDGDMYTVLGTVDLEEHVRVHIAANGPDRIVRDCERDLKVLARHGPARRLGGTHEICSHDWADSDGWLSMWPCAEIGDMAVAYGITEASDG